MTTSHYRAGADFERAVRTHLIQDGYWVMKSGGSKTKVDLIAIKPGHQLFIQCKRDGKCGPDERTELLRVAALVEGVPVIAYRDRGIKFRLLNGPGPKQWEPWTPDEVGA